MLQPSGNQWLTVKYSFFIKKKKQLALTLRV